MPPLKIVPIDGACEMSVRALAHTDNRFLPSTLPSRSILCTHCITHTHIVPCEVIGEHLTSTHTRWQTYGYVRRAPDTSETAHNYLLHSLRLFASFFLSFLFVALRNKLVFYYTPKHYNFLFAFSSSLLYCIHLQRTPICTYVGIERAANWMYDYYCVIEFIS